MDVVTSLFGSFGKNILTTLLLILLGLSGWVLTATVSNGYRIGEVAQILADLKDPLKNIVDKNEQLEHRITAVEQRLTDHAADDARMYPAPRR